MPGGMQQRFEAGELLRAGLRGQRDEVLVAGVERLDARIDSLQPGEPLGQAKCRPGGCPGQFEEGLQVDLPPPPGV